MGTLYIIHDEIPDDDIGWKLYSPKLFYVWNDKKYNIINRASAWTEKIIKNKPTGTYEVSNKVPSSISSQILPIIQFKENKMTMKQKQLIENYIRLKVKKVISERKRLVENPDEIDEDKLQEFADYLDKFMTKTFKLVKRDLSNAISGKDEHARKILVYGLKRGYLEDALLKFIESHTLDHKKFNLD